MRKLLWLVAVIPLLAACQQPVPAVTAATIGDSVRAEAICWSAQPSAPLGDQCRLDASLIKELAVVPGEFVGFSVDKEIAEAGWIVRINGQQVTGVLTSRYHRFSTGENTFSRGDLEVEISALTPQNQGRGVWGFVLTSR